MLLPWVFLFPLLRYIHIIFTRRIADTVYTTSPFLNHVCFSIVTILHGSQSVNNQRVVLILDEYHVHPSHSSHSVTTIERVVSLIQLQHFLMHPTQHHAVSLKIWANVHLLVSMHSAVLQIMNVAAMLLSYRCVQ